MTTLTERTYEGEEIKSVIVDSEVESFLDRFFEGEKAKSLISEIQELIDLLKMYS